MNRWEEQFDNHQIHDTLNQILNWLDIELDDIDEGDVTEIRRCRNVIELIIQTVSELNAEMTPFNQLDGLNNQLRHQNVWNQFSSFGSNKNVQHIVNANNHLHSVLQHLNGLMPFTKIRGYNESIESLESSIDQVLNGLTNKKNTLNNELDDLKNDVAALTKEKEQLESLIEQRKQDVDQQISQWQQQFSDAQEKRSDLYNDWRNNIESEIKAETKALVSETQSEVELLEKTTNEEITQILEDATRKHQEIKDLFQLASGDSISGGYSQFADKERFQSHLWRGVAVLFICVTAWWIFSAYENAILPEDSTVLAVDETEAPKVESKDTESEIAAVQKQVVKPKSSNFDWHRFLLSISLTGVLLFGAGYAGQQSNRHRENEKQMRWFALQIKALDPYINSLEPDDQKELKKTLSEKFFNGVHEIETPQGMVDEHAIGVVVKAMTDAIKATKP